MASKQSEAVSELYRISVTEAAQRPDRTPEDQRGAVESRRGTLTGEPSGDDSIDVDRVTSVPVLNPQGASADRVPFGIRREGHS